MFYSFKTIFLVVGGGGGGWVVVVGGGGGVEMGCTILERFSPLKGPGVRTYISVTIRFSIDSCVGS